MESKFGSRAYYKYGDLNHKSVKCKKEINVVFMILNFKGGGGGDGEERLEDGKPLFLFP